jgi:phosphate uptake regulator
MKRKLIKQGKNALTVTLPAVWLEKNSLKAGDEIGVSILNNMLQISSSEMKDEIKKVHIHYPDEVYFLKRIIISLYRKGADEITITSEKKIPLSRVSSKISELPGYEVIEHSPKRIIIKNVSVPKKEEFETIFRRFFRLTISFSKEVLETIQKSDIDGLKEISVLDKEVNRLYNFCFRVLNQEDMPDKVHYLQAMDYIELIGDQLDDLCRSMPKEKISKQFSGLFGRVIDMLERVYQLAFKFDYGNLQNVKAERIALFEEAKVLLPKTKAESILFTHSYVIMESLFHIETYLLKVEDHLQVEDANLGL